MLALYSSVHVVLCEPPTQVASSVLVTFGWPRSLLTVAVVMLVLAYSIVCTAAVEAVAVTACRRRRVLLFHCCTVFPTGCSNVSCSLFARLFCV